MNNCIGKENYQNFRLLIVAQFAYCLTSLLLFVQAMVMGVVNEEHLGNEIFSILVYIQVGTNLITLAFDMHLICLHRWLFARQMSTFDYVAYEREHAEMKSKLKSGWLT